MSGAQWFNRIWYEQPQPPGWLKPLSGLYGALMRARRLAYARGLCAVVPLERPVIVVGNLTVGGTGKTPLVCWLARRLQERGFEPGIVTRGYGGTVREAHLLESTDPASAVGDEAVLIARRTHAPVAVGRRRPAAARLLIEAGCDVVLSDDGLQHYALERACEIVVIDGERRFGNGWLLPAGPLREGRERLAGVDVRVVNGGTDPATGADPALAADPLIQGALRMRLEARVAISMHDGRERELEAFAGSRVHALAAIGHPQRFFNMLRTHGLELEPHALDDHQPLGAGEIRFADGAPVLMTEKDAVKCEGLADERHWYVPVEVRFDEQASSALIGTVLDRIARARALPGARARSAARSFDG
jgi:tetraacyldisaccharide 4'-kinase